MAVFNFTEKLFLAAKQKTALQSKLTDIQMKQLAASRQASKAAQEFNQQLQDLYYDEEHGYGTEEYSQLYNILVSDHQYESAELTEWENVLDIEKNSIEVQLNELKEFESNWTNTLKKNISTDFNYGQLK